MKRIAWIDEAKGIGIILVILGHHLMGVPNITNWINSFHMPMFFIISGILYANKNTEKICIKGEAISRAKKLLYPYVTFSAIVFIWYIMWYGILLNGAQPEESYMIVILKIVTTYGYHALWFLPALFISTELYMINRRNEHIACILFIIAGSILAGIADYMFDIDLFFGHILRYITRIVIATSFIFIGDFLYRVFKKISKDKEWIVLVISVVISICLFKYNGQTFNFATTNIGNPIVYYILAIAGSLVIIITCKKVSYKSRFFNYVGRNSLIIMALHMEFPVEIGWIIVGGIGITDIISTTMCSIIVIFIELLILYICIEIINNKFPFVVKYPNKK